VLHGTCLLYVPQLLDERGPKKVAQRLPLSPPWDVEIDIVTRVARAIASGIDDASLPGLAESKMPL
jgi:hypothetical protein